MITVIKLIPIMIKITKIMKDTVMSILSSIFIKFLIIVASIMWLLWWILIFIMLAIVNSCKLIILLINTLIRIIVCHFLRLGYFCWDWIDFHMSIIYYWIGIWLIFKRCLFYDINFWFDYRLLYRISVGRVLISIISLIIIISFLWLKSWL